MILIVTLSSGMLDGDNVKMCWVGMPWKLVGFMIPIYLCLVLNLVLFIMIGRIIIKAGKSGSAHGHSVSEDYQSLILSPIFGYSNSSFTSIKCGNNNV